MKRMQKSAGMAIALAAIGLVGASGASATTLEVGGVTQNNAVTINAHLATGTSILWKGTSGNITNTCTTSAVSGTTSTFTGNPTGALSTLTFENCTRRVTVHNMGKLFVEHIVKTTNGTMYSEETEVTVEEPLFGYVICTTGAGTHIGTLTASASHATIDINAVINCGAIKPSVKWEGEYKITSPTGLGVSA